MSFSFNTDDSFMSENTSSQELDIELDNNTNTIIFNDKNKKTRSSIWVHYTWDNTNSKAKCNYCG